MIAIYMYDLSTDAQYAAETCKLINADSECFKIYQEVAGDQKKGNIIHEGHDQGLKTHLDNMYEIILAKLQEVY